VRDQLGRKEGLPFLDILTSDLVATACRNCNHFWRERLYTPWITLGMMLSQVLSEDHSCDEAVDRFQKFRHDQGLPFVSADTSSYCEARLRLPEPLFWDLVQRTGQTIHQNAKASWLFHGRSVKIVDGSTVTMPDTPRNQAVYPQQKSQAPGLGFPIARILVVFSLAVGTVLDAAVGPYHGKQTGELALFRPLGARFQRGDILLADRFYCSFWLIAEMQARGVDVVVRLHQARKTDFQQGRRLGPEDHCITWKKPEQVPPWMTRAEYDAMPAELTMRELQIRVREKTKRVRNYVIATTLTDATKYPAQELGRLFRERWHAELDLRSLKSVMHMDMLRAKSPEMVRKEVAAHMLAYNLIRGIMAEAARQGSVIPRKLSFKGALHTVRCFEESHLYDPLRIQADLPQLLLLIRQKRAGGRPDRYDPRAIKRRSNTYRLLSMPRADANRLIEQGVTPYDKKHVAVVPCNLAQVLGTK
jgi:hypothetical protein